MKKGVLKKFANFIGKQTPVLESVFDKIVFGPATLLKRTPKQVFYYEICELLKNTYFEEYLRTTASTFSL